MAGAVSGFNQICRRYLRMLRPFGGLGMLALRLFLGPIFILAGLNKLGSIDDVAAWFGNPDWGLGLPAPGYCAGLSLQMPLPVFRHIDDILADYLTHAAPVTRLAPVALRPTPDAPVHT